ncbi:MAG: hypothetical protein KAU06_03695 [Candidatus Marinimicrobia bacterium]|nr:hypothetical protein [Candidatus Neomarinimicrobiota bacterium]
MTRKMTTEQFIDLLQTTSDDAYANSWQGSEMVDEEQLCIYRTCQMGIGTFVRMRTGQEGHDKITKMWELLQSLRIKEDLSPLDTLKRISGSDADGVNIPKYGDQNEQKT